MSVPAASKFSSAPAVGVSAQVEGQTVRVGGPYRITAVAPQFNAGATTLQGVGVGDAAVVDVRLARAGEAEVAELVVTAAAAAPAQGGPSSNFTASDIASLPSISRDLKDVARLDPFATIDPTNSDAISFGGVKKKATTVELHSVDTQVDEYA